MKKHTTQILFAIFLAFITSFLFKADQLFIIAMIGLTLSISSYITKLFMTLIEEDYERIVSELGTVVTPNFYIPTFFFSCITFACSVFEIAEFFNSL